MSRRYGPHREADTPPNVTVLRPYANARGQEEVEVPRPLELRKQRAQINRHAHKAGRA